MQLNMYRCPNCQYFWSRVQKSSTDICTKCNTVAKAYASMEEEEKNESISN